MSREGEERTGWGLWIDTAVLYWTTAAIVVLGVCLGHFYLAESRSQDHFHTPHRTDLVAAFANWDGQWYARIAREGYRYDPNAQSSVAFYPAFPLAGRFVAWATGLDYDLALTLAANVCFFLALALFGDYLRHRPDHPADPNHPAAYACLALALCPVGFFFRMAYSESLFLLLSILTLYGLLRQWPILAVAIVVGLATAARPVGAALIPPLLLAAWRRNRGLTPPARRLAILALAAPLCVWGLAAYMIFQQARFGDALAFVKTQVHWRFREPAGRAEQLLAAATLETLWSAYDESSPAYWRRYDHDLSPIFSLHFANTIYFTGAAALVGYGAWRRWLSAEEILFAAGVLLIPYLSMGHEGCLHSHARYATVAFPIYVVLGRFLSALPSSYAAVVLALSGFLLGSYAALFAGWFFFI